jgi:hypothetical protein
VSTGAAFSTCPKCGIIIKKYYDALETKKRTEAEILESQKKKEAEAGPPVQQEVSRRAPAPQDNPPPRESQQGEARHSMSEIDHKLLLACAFLLFVIAGVLGVDLYFRIDERMQHQAVVAKALKIISEMDSKRADVFKDYTTDLASYETKSIYHQIYHANNAQLKMLNLIVQGNELLVTLSSGKK